MNKKYTVSLRAPFTSGWSKTHHDSLAKALTSAWRKHSRNCSVDNITHDNEIVIDSERMAQALDEMDHLVREVPKRQPQEIAEQIIREIYKTEPAP